MTESKTLIENIEIKKKSKYSLFRTLRKLMLASLGLIAITQDELEKILAKLVERGEVAKEDAEKLMNEILKHPRKHTQKIEDEITKKVEKTIERLKIPTRADIEMLSKHIDDLDKKIDELKKE